MTKDTQYLAVLLRAWVAVVGVTATCGWGLAAAGYGQLTGWVALVVLGLLAIRFGGGVWGAVRSESKALVGWWSMAILVLLMVVLAFAYLPAVPDTLSYRLPRIRLWMQDGDLTWYWGADRRCNTLGRNWEWLGMALLQVFRSERLLALPSLISWILLSRIFFVWAERFVGPGLAGRCSALVLSTSPLFIVQGFTTMNDLTATTLVAASVFFLLLAWETGDKRVSGIEMVFSGLALALATGVKPNLATLAILWCVGALIWMHRKQGVLPWKLLAVAAPVALVASGLPTIILNIVHAGSPMGGMETSERSVAPSSPLMGVGLGHLMFWWQSAQPVFNPFSGTLHAATAGIEASLRQFAPRFQLETMPFACGAGANIGMFSMIVIAVGVLLAFWKGRRESKEGFRTFVLVAIFGMIAISANFAIALPGAVARSSNGFVMTLVPLALLGIGMLKGRWKLFPPLLAVMAAFACLLHIALEPSRSLVPANLKADLIKKVGGKRGAEVAEMFRRFRDRRFSGKKLYEKVPEGEEAIGICLSEPSPTSPAWRYLPRGTEVRFYGTGQLLDQLAEAPERYFVLVAGNVDENGAVLARTDLFEVVAEETYMVRMSEPDQQWYLVKRKEAAPAP